MAETKVLDRVAGGYSYMASEDGVTRVGTIVDVSGIVEQVKDRRSHGLNDHAFGRHEMSIPLETLDAWAKKISGGLMNAFDVASDDALLNRFIQEHGSFKVHGGWE